jgi:iron complex transport system substrate-binding protein
MPLKRFLLICCIALTSCKQNKNELKTPSIVHKTYKNSYAKGFTVEKLTSGITRIEVNSPWPGAEETFVYALVPKDSLNKISLNKAEYDAVVAVPVERVVVTSTTHIPALEALGVLEKCVGFPGTQYVSSKEARKRIDADLILELGSNETMNTELALSLRPDLVVGFGINNQNKIYETLTRSHIPVVYNGDWTEETPLGKSEWIKFFAPFFGKDQQADSIFASIEASYTASKALAQKASSTPTVLSGALYKDVWYLPGGKSWAAQFIADANGDYLWKDTQETGSLSLSIESVLQNGKEADIWISPSQFTAYEDMAGSSKHYALFNAFKNKRIHTFSLTTGATGGLLYYELAPNRPDLVLKDLIHIFHPELLPGYDPFFFKPLN